MIFQILRQKHLLNWMTSKSLDFCSKQYDEFAKCNEGLVRKIDLLGEENSELKGAMSRP